MFSVIWTIIAITCLVIAGFAGHYRAKNCHALANTLTASHLGLLVLAGYVLF
jgi:hypothetical protein